MSAGTCDLTHHISERMRERLNPMTCLVEPDAPNQGSFTFTGVPEASKVEIVLIGVAPYAIFKRQWPS
jgi:hypothetical protein